MLIYITIFGKTDKKVIIEQKYIIIIDQDRPLFSLFFRCWGKGFHSELLQFTIIYVIDFRIKNYKTNLLPLLTSIYDGGS